MNLDLVLGVDLGLDLGLGLGLGLGLRVGFFIGVDWRRWVRRGMAREEDGGWRVGGGG